jgi:hypothetical protein
MKAYNVAVEDVKTWDYPDFCDAYITYAEHEDGTAFTDDELEVLNDDKDFVWNSVMKRLY